VNQEMVYAILLLYFYVVLYVVVPFEILTL